MTDSVDTRTIRLDPYSVREIADGGSTTVIEGELQVLLAGHRADGLGQIVWLARMHRVPLLLLEDGELLELVRHRPVALEKWGIRYQIEVCGVESGDDWDDDPED